MKDMQVPDHNKKTHSTYMRALGHCKHVREKQKDYTLIQTRCAKHLAVTNIPFRSFVMIQIYHMC